jgi:hypothetical protein
MLSRVQTLGLVSALTLLGACSKKGDITDHRAQTPTATIPAQGQAVKASGAMLTSYWATQKLIRSAELRIEVKDVQKTMRSVDSAVRLHGALLADSRLSQDAQERRQAELTIHVPSEHFLETIVALRQFGDLKSETVKTQDVTKEYADLETRLAVKEQTVARLRALLDGRTAKLADVLEVERELSRAVTEFEQLKGERRFYDQQIAISSISVVLVEGVTSRGVQFAGPIADALRSSVGVLGSSLSSLIYVIAFLLPWAALAILLWWPYTWVRVRMRGTPPATPPSTR